MGSGLFSIGSRALLANTAVLNTIGHNISNANTEGYSRQSVTLATEGGRYTGAGFYGRGVRITSVDRSSSPFLAKELNAATSVAASDQARLDKLKQLEKVFPTGEQGLGYAASQLLNAFVDVANQPQDTSARQVVLARAEDYASRMRTAAEQLVNLQDSVFNDLDNSVQQINNYTAGIAKINDQIAQTMGTGHSPNDLMDQRDQLVNELSGLLQVTTVAAQDGTIGVFIGGGQPLVLGSRNEQVTLVKNEYDPTQGRLAIETGNSQLVIDERFLTSGSVAGLLRVQNEDIPSGRNLLGQMAAALSWRLNQQQSFGLDLVGKGNPGSPLFSDPASSMEVLPSNLNTSALTPAAVSMSVVDGRQLQALDYTLKADPTNPGSFLMTRSNAPDQPFTVTNGSIVDGFRIDVNPANPPSNTDTFVLRPVGTTARNLTVKLDKPIGIAASSPFVAVASASNKGTASVSSLTMNAQPDLTQPPSATTGLLVRFKDDAGNFDLEFPQGTPIYSGTWVPGQAISYNGFDLKLDGVPRNGDTLTVERTAYPSSNNGNAMAMLNLRDEDLVGRSIIDSNFDGIDDNGDGPAPGANITNAYSQAIGSVGVRVQGAATSANISQTIADSAQQTLSNITGVNLDEEAARMIQYQQAYQAAAKVLQIAQGIFDTLLQTARG